MRATLRMVDMMYERMIARTRRRMRMTVLTLAGSKGGCGKSTLGRAMSALLAREGASFAVVDADPNKALSRWLTAIYEGPEITHCAEANEDRLAHLIAELRDQHDLVLVDTAGFENLGSSVAIASADAVLIPCKASEADLYEARTTATKVKSLSVTTRRTIPAWVILNSVRTTAVAAHAAEQIKEAGLERLSASLGHRADYEAVSHTGKMPTSGAAFREVTDLIAELRAKDAMPAVRVTA
ncbi:ParA protein (plasmid) [Roseomonas mucosa]|nr:ParA protein [Roseomonas mucosa]QDD97524.1 ParA protein [Roseomonas mucosa]QET95729.1 ParA family protein [Roseomonas mucosa]UZO94889.1 ParA protein [Roseomonas mucosa]SUE95724.1 putative crown gall tumor protein VirC1 [Roseomonas mucosa]